MLLLHKFLTFFEFLIQDKMQKTFNILNYSYIFLMPTYLFFLNIKLIQDQIKENDLFLKKNHEHYLVNQIYSNIILKYPIEYI